METQLLSCGERAKCFSRRTEHHQLSGMPLLLFFLFLLPGVLADDDINPDIYLDVPGLITKYGFPVETHIVQTEDGYLLTLHRIPHSRKGGSEDQNRVVARQPILMQHGLLSSSSSWIMGAPEKAPGQCVHHGRRRV
ncbi:lysosomal acid lipase/cholesteryl ester hydrolase-like [Scylla paramamosain]|uniref:lysosomal acid lipase/cholesteryl ester hydrolase-like n=1 Tax=Scylla paramamosain TaxID=85552 RepID=UPI003082D85F